MDVLNNNKIELTCDDYKLEFTLAINDVYGHYIDDVVYQYNNKGYPYI